jgi:uncharacterized membrane protein
MLLALGATAFAIALLVAPAAPSWLSVPMYAVGSIICHQLPERSFHIGGVQLPVCARCLGIYAGAAAIALWTWLAPAAAYRVIAPVSRVRVMLLAAALPTVVTVLVEWVTPVQTSNALRALAGAPLGGAGALVMARAMATLHYERCTRRPLVPSSPQQPPI